MVTMPAGFGVVLGDLTDRLMKAARNGRVDDVLALNTEISGLAKQIATAEMNDIEKGRLMASLREAAKVVSQASFATQGILRNERVADRHRPAYRHIDRKLAQ